MAQQLNNKSGAVSGLRGQRAFRPAVRVASRRTAVVVRADRCLIVNTKGGGHAFIGLYLAKALLAKGHDVTIFNDGDQVCRVCV
jgi:hypothetical protein